MSTSKKLSFRSDKISSFIVENRAFIILLFLSVVVAFASDTFFSIRNLTNVTRQVAVSCVMGVGFTCLVAAGNLDLSCGAMLGLLGVIQAQLSSKGVPLPLVVLCGVALGAALGFVNGFVSSKFRLNPFIVTLATQQIFRGIGYLLCHNKPVTGLNDSFVYLGQGYIGALPVPVLIAALVTVIVFVVLYHTAFGRHIVAIGGNANAAHASGINVSNVRIGVYCLMGVCVGIASTIYTARVASAQPSAGNGMEMDIICAVVLGGTGLAGGKGKIGGTICGCLIVGVINNGLNLLKVDSNWQLIAKGLLIVLAIVIDSQTEALAQRRMKKQQSNN